MIWSLIPLKAWLAAGAVALALSAYGYARWDAVRDDRAAREAQDAKDYIEGTKDARDATNDLPDTDSERIEWLLGFPE